MLHGALPMPADVTITDLETTAEDGVSILLRWYTKDGVNPGSAVLYAHGGGMILSNVGIYDGPVARYVSATGVPFLSVEYRYAPEFPAPIPVTDCYAGLQWLATHAEELGVDPARIAIMGDSGGGGVTASLAVYARDQGGPSIARQILIYPMLDDRNTTPDPELVGVATWSYDDNATGWGALLGDAAGGPDVSPYAAAARLEDFTALPPAYIEVGARHLPGRGPGLCAAVGGCRRQHRAPPAPPGSPRVRGAGSDGGDLPALGRGPTPRPWQPLTNSTPQATR